MTTIETSIAVSPNNISKLFGFLCDMRHFEQILPQDKVEKWEAEEDQCSFTIKGMSRIGLKRKSVEAPSTIFIESHGKVPFDFELEIQLKEQAEDQTSVQIIFQGEINAFLKMMVEKPLKNFFESLVNKASGLKL
tara:strand:- start:84 stop:488 length:405 start_codon:yes stop_codon:yes gene_type:complete